MSKITPTVGNDEKKMYGVTNIVNVSTHFFFQCFYLIWGILLCYEKIYLTPS